jgi:hypothetical protein
MQRAPKRITSVVQLELESVLDIGPDVPEVSTALAPLQLGEVSDASSPPAERVSRRRARPEAPPRETSSLTRCPFPDGE